MLRRAALGLAAAVVAVQLLPVGPARTNPPVVQDAPWPDGRARELAVAACYDCHSNQTRWPAYSAVAPFRWLVARDVQQGREELNFSDWQRDAGEAGDAAEAVVEGSMPPRRYLLAHPGARLSPAERAALAAALAALGGDGDGGRGRG